MMRLMRRLAWLRAAVGLTAAYVLALQMLLGGVAATQMAVADPAASIICYGDHQQSGQDGKTGTRIHHASCVVCALASLAPPVPEIADVLAPVAVAATAVSTAIAVLPPARLRHEPRTSQGPPATA
jgi:hypothetical protein